MDILEFKNARFSTNSNISCKVNEKGDLEYVTV